jgi:hypothetical protein
LLGEKNENDEKTIENIKTALSLVVESQSRDSPVMETTLVKSDGINVVQPKTFIAAKAPNTAEPIVQSAIRKIQSEVLNPNSQLRETLTNPQSRAELRSGIERSARR